MKPEIPASAIRDALEQNAESANEESWFHGTADRSFTAFDPENGTEITTRQ